MTCKEIVSNWLKANGYDGLLNCSGECGCLVDDLMNCEEPSEDCEAGHRIGPDDLDWPAWATDEGHEWLIVGGKRSTCSS